MDIERTTMASRGAESMRDRLRRALPEAMKARDSVAVAALRTALAAIDNAETVASGKPAPPSVGNRYLAGTVDGLRDGEVERRSLTDAEMEEIVRVEIVERQAAARDYQHAGQLEHAKRLRDEADVLSRTSLAQAPTIRVAPDHARTRG
jgi:uncharacterized protein YqeY